MRLKEIELYDLKGGAITATLLNAISRAVTTIYDLGRAIGSSIRRISTRNYC